MAFTISKGKLQTPVRAVIYGVEGIGKSTLASQTPDPLFIDIEDGTHQLDVARIDTPDSWRMLKEEIAYIRDNPDLCKTLVIDTADRAEELCRRAILEENGVETIEKFGYGKGYVMAAEKFEKEFLNKLDELTAKGLNVVLLAHAKTEKQENPEDPPFDKWGLTLDKRITPKVRAWADLVLFCNYKIMVIEENGRNKAKGSARRMMFANHRPTFDAKNRYDLPDEMELSYEPLRAIFERKVKRQPVKETLQVDTPLGADGIVEETAEMALDALLRHLKAKRVKSEDLFKYLVERGKIAPDGALTDLEDNYIEALDTNIEKLIDQIKKKGGKK